jgi:hypothetical protein
MKLTWFVWIPLALILASCASIGTPQPSPNYVGDAGRTEQVAGRVTHWDFFGLGTSAQTYSNEFNLALSRAFEAAPPGTLQIKAIKSYKTIDPVIPGVGAALVSIGVTQYQRSLPVTAAFILVGLAIIGVNHYDLILVGEPSQQPR